MLPDRTNPQLRNQRHNEKLFHANKSPDIFLLYIYEKIRMCGYIRVKAGE